MRRPAVVAASAPSYPRTVRLAASQ